MSSAMVCPKALAMAEATGDGETPEDCEVSPDGHVGIPLT